MQQPVIGLVLANHKRSILVFRAVCMMHNGLRRQRFTQGLFGPNAVGFTKGISYRDVAVAGSGPVFPVMARDIAVIFPYDVAVERRSSSNSCGGLTAAT
jgi:hypothetical protein